MLPTNMALVLGDPDVKDPESHKSRTVQKVMKGFLHLETIRRGGQVDD